MTHDDLVKRAVRWLKTTGRCGVAVPELVTWMEEQPDAIGWRSSGAICVLVECKVSRSDFLRDQKKAFRAHPEYGVGNKRYYMTLPGLLKPDELPKNWGLLEVHPKIVRVVKQSGDFVIAYNNVKSEAFLYSLLRRMARRNLLHRCLSKKWRRE